MARPYGRGCHGPFLFFRYTWDNCYEHTCAAFQLPPGLSNNKLSRNECRALSLLFVCHFIVVRVALIVGVSLYMVYISFKKIQKEWVSGGNRWHDKKQPWEPCFEKATVLPGCWDRKRPGHATRCMRAFTRFRPEAQWSQICQLSRKRIWRSKSVYILNIDNIS